VIGGNPDAHPSADSVQQGSPICGHQTNHLEIHEGETWHSLVERIHQLELKMLITNVELSTTRVDA
jgi:transcriptional regulator of NAD metabolism